VRSFRLAYLADVDDFGAVLALKNCLDTHRHLTVGASDKGPLSHHGNGLPSIGAESGENRVAVQEVELLIVRLFLGLLLLDRLLLHWDVHDGGWRDFRYSLQRSSKGLVVLGDPEPAHNGFSVFAVRGRLPRPRRLSSTQH